MGIGEDINEPTLGEAIRAVFVNMLSEIHTVLPGQIEEYDRSKHKASVKPLIKKLFVDGTILELPVIVSVPVIWPRTKKASFSFPLSRGDGVLLLFSERALDKWLTLGGDSTPDDPRKFDLTDAIAIPGLFSFQESALEPNDDSVHLIYKNSSIVIKSSGQVDINDGNLTVDL